MAVTTPAARSAALAPRDRARLITVTVSEVLCILGTLLGVGVFGGEAVNQTAGGALSADATLLAPAGPAFSIWSVIYLGLAAHTLFQWLPSQRSAERQRRIGWLVAASMLLNAGWLLVVSFAPLWLSVVVIAALVLVLGLIVRELARTPSTGLLETVVVDGTMGLYVGWVSVAVCANITAFLVAEGVRVSGFAGEAIAAGVLIVAAAVAFLLLKVSRGNLAIGAAMAWGIAWIAVGRLSGAPESMTTAVVALAVAAVIVVLTIAARAAAAGWGARTAR